MADSIREQIIQAIVTRLSDITATKAYQTNAGSFVYRTTKRIDEEFLPACVVWAGDETADTLYDYLEIIMPVRVEAISAFGSDNPSVVGEKLLADVQECLLSAKQTVTFSTGASEIIAGQTLTGATTAKTGYVESVTVSSGSWTGGDAAGTIVLRRNTGEFQDNENLKIGSTIKCKCLTAVMTPVIQNVLGTYGKGINYTGGGYDNFPESGESVIIVAVNFDVKYHVKEGNPYST